jgi:nucleoside phosphorylase
MASPPLILVCFAVKEESNPFERAAKAHRNIRVALTGMGRMNAEKAIRRLLHDQRPDMVISSGFAGGLKPDLVSGTVVYAADQTVESALPLLAAGAYQVRFLCSGRVAATAVEKGALRKSTGADAIEMESEVICSICSEARIPSATIRVILDAAHEDLPLDFNQVMTKDQQLDWRKMTLVLINSPRKVAALLRLQKRSRAAAARLSEALLKVLVS